MHIQSQFQQVNERDLHNVINANPLATFIVGGASPVANHFPMLLSPDGETLLAHVPKANEVWQQLDGTQEVLAIFSGPSGYISPNWYPSKKANARVVPTWNYVAVHVYGAAVAQHERDWKLTHVTELTQRHEAEQPEPWQVADAPVEFTNKLLDHIVGIEMPIERVQGKWKLSQNRSSVDRAGVIAALQEESALKIMMEKADQ